MTPSLPRPGLTEHDLILLELITADAVGISADQMPGAIDPVLATTGTRTHAAAQRILTATAAPCATQTAAPALPRRRLQVLRWAGGPITCESAAEALSRTRSTVDTQETQLNHLFFPQRRRTIAHLTASQGLPTAARMLSVPEAAAGPKPEAAR